MRGVPDRRPTMETATGRAARPPPRRGSEPTRRRRDPHRYARPTGPLPARVCPRCRPARARRSGASGEAVTKPRIPARQAGGSDLRFRHRGTVNGTVSGTAHDLSAPTWSVAFEDEVRKCASPSFFRGCPAPSLSHRERKRRRRQRRRGRPGAIADESKGVCANPSSRDTSATSRTAYTHLAPRSRTRQRRRLSRAGGAVRRSGSFRRSGRSPSRDDEGRRRPHRSPGSSGPRSRAPAPTRR